MYGAAVGRESVDYMFSMCEETGRKSACNQMVGTFALDMQMIVPIVEWGIGGLAVGLIAYKIRQASEPENTL